MISPIETFDMQEDANLGVGRAFNGGSRISLFIASS